MIRRLLYLGYYVKETDWKKFWKFVHFASQSRKLNKFKILTDVLASSLRYNISFLEYFYFKFFEISDELRADYSGTGFMYEYQLAMNPRNTRHVLDDKIQFYTRYAPFVKHKVVSIEKLTADSTSVNNLLANSSSKIVLKDAHGKCGAQVAVFNTNDFDKHTLLERMKSGSYDMAEEFVIQHPALMALSPSALNTVRIFTQLDSNDEVQFLGARLRISVNSHVDNLAAGNVAAPIDINTGIVVGPGVYSDITKAPETIHPVTGISIVGFQIPFWKEVIEMITRAAKHDTSNRSIGWDIAVTATGPELIEGNHDWCKLVWQLPVGKGLKPLLDQHLAQLKNTR